MGEIYGDKWTNAFGEEPNGQWTLEICNLTRREVLFGIEQCKRSKSPFVPTLPQFLAYCEMKGTKQTEQAADILNRQQWQGSDVVRHRELTKMKAQYKFPRPHKACDS
jgi:hypothetical protein